MKKSTSNVFMFLQQLEWEKRLSSSTSDEKLTRFWSQSLKQKDSGCKHQPWHRAGVFFYAAFRGVKVSLSKAAATLFVGVYLSTKRLHQQNVNERRHADIERTASEIMLILWRQESISWRNQQSFLPPLSPVLDPRPWKLCHIKMEDIYKGN